MTRSRTSAIALSLALHIVIFAAGMFSVNFSQPMAMPHRLAIEATLVDLSAVQAKDDAEREARRKEDQAREDARLLRLEKERLAVEKLEQEKSEAAEALRREQEESEKLRLTEQKQREEDERAAQKVAQEKMAREKFEQEKLAQEKLAAEKLAREKLEQEKQAELKRQKEAEEKRQAEVERKRQEEVARKKREEESRRQAERESLLLAQLEEEERRLSAANSGLKEQYALLIRQKITRNWLRPESAGPGLECEVSVTQLPSREVVGVKVGRCNGDAATMRSIEAAVYKASPLPAPPDPTLFERKLTIIFKPDQ